MSNSRKLVIALVSVFAVLLLLLIAIPLMFSGQISERLQAEAGKRVNAKVAWSGASLGLLRNFPNLSLKLNDLTITGVGAFEGDTLAATEQFGLVLDLGSVLRNIRRGDAIVVRQVQLNNPVARLLVLEDGTANWDIMREQPDAAADTSGAMSLSLKRLAVSDGDIRFENRQSGLLATVIGLDHTLSGDLTQDVVNLATRTSADSVSVRFAGVPYLSDAALELEADVNANMVERKFTFANDMLRLNNLELAFNGSVAVGEENTALDMTFSTPSTDFRDILSLVPAIYTSDFESLETSGTMTVDGSVTGEYGPNAFPALVLNANVENGTFRYPDLPLPAREIFLNLAVTNPGGDVDSTVVEVSRLHLQLGDRPLDARFVMRNPVSDPDIDLSLTGSVDLADVGRTVKLENVNELSGIVAADLAMRTRRSWVDARQYDRISARGTLDARSIALQSATLPHAMNLDSLLLRFTPQHAELTAASGTIGNSDFRATGELDNLLGFALHDQELRGRATVASNHFDLNEWRSEEEATEVVPVPANLDFTADIRADSVSFSTFGMTNARGALRVKDERITLDGFRLNMFGGGVVASGFYETTDIAAPSFDVDLAVEQLDIPTAVASVTTIQALAPIARYATGALSANLDLVGVMGQDMSPVLSALTGRGAFETGKLVVEGFPALVRLSDLLSLEQLRNPALDAVRSSFEIVDGRLHVRPFDVNLGPLALTVSGSNGIDQTLDYDIAMAIPSSMLGSAANDAIGRLASQAGRAGINLQAAEVVSLNVDVTGSVTSPTVSPNFAGTAGSLTEGVRQAVETEVEDRIADVEQRVDSAREAATQRAREEAARLVAEAEEQADRIRQEGDSLAAKLRREGEEQADALLERATNPAARIAARAAADRLRSESGQQADRIEREADERADALVARAQQRAEELVGGVGGAPPD
ncbi:MAG TPA: AsmA-like C-terminal region-containing protein [Gemmatimonadales bacterium]|nr:AsmA-like C-terminal region-containing protein [Gemmatimonadales bacterium]